ncbi:hypothetical protein JXK06_01360 [Patescibacteria group bacterium]|nr:hypothetical protein [Patescibacteria group bacterium]
MEKTKFSKIKVANLLLTFSLGLLIAFAITSNKLVFYVMICTILLGIFLKFLGNREKYLKIKKDLKT